MTDLRYGARALLVTCVSMLMSTAPVLAQAPVGAQARTEPIIIGVKTSVRSKILGETRPVWIHLPATYGMVPGRYPVIYLLDGNDHFTEVTGIVQRLAGNQRMPDAIIVALPNTSDRTRDLSPPAASDSIRAAMFQASPDTISQHFPTRGGSRNLLAFITQELAPWIEHRYTTAPYRILIGHSLGGLFVLDALMHQPESFRAYVALSPSLWWDDHRYVDTVEAGLSRARLDGTALYMTTGSREPAAAMIVPAQQLADFLGRSQFKGFRWSYRVMPGEIHNTNPHRSEYDALEWIFDGFEPHDSVLAALYTRADSMPLVNHYATLSRQLGYTVPYPVSTLDDWGHFFMSTSMFDRALRLFRFNVAHAPTWPGAYGGLADGLEAAGAKADAIGAAAKALHLATASHDSTATRYRTQLARLRKAAPVAPRP